MRNWIAKLGLAAAFGLVPGAALAQSGEVFVLEVTGTLRCTNAPPDNFVEKIGTRNNPDLWLRTLDGQEWDISFDPTFEANPDVLTIPVIGLTRADSATKLVFNGSQFAGDAFTAIEGTAVLDKSGIVKKASGVIIDQFLADVGCFFSGKFKTGARLVPQ
jgi:hypothetical protein